MFLSIIFFVLNLAGLWFLSVHVLEWWMSIHEAGLTNDAVVVIVIVLYLLLIIVQVAKFGEFLLGD